MVVFVRFLLEKKSNVQYSDNDMRKKPNLASMWYFYVNEKGKVYYDAALVSIM
ncbi:hypothetical protein CWI37_1997p0010 [Hamiltosporidium tvaerminnensis]|uniref:Uncharacterized protein n=1 Tax=Hamiltosporidium tvaerminnensis TaxID=1176355 RepID=A0A4Q9KV67_9MICR|nr:hypothetical protein CWI37_1997p0010 [Hamiltosporidium tvaerminnensis]